MYNQCGCEKLEKWGDHWWNYVFAMAPRAGLYLILYVRCFCTQRALDRPAGRQNSLAVCVYNLITGWHKSAPGPAIIGVWRRGHNPEDWPTSNPQGRRIVFSAGAIALTLNQKQCVHCMPPKCKRRQRRRLPIIYSHHIWPSTMDLILISGPDYGNWRSADFFQSQSQNIYQIKYFK